MAMPRRGAPATSNRAVVLGTLMLVYVSSYLDRQILAILLPAIKAEFQVSDTFLGLLSGLAFALFYTTLGLPLARIADSKSRVNLLAACIAAWSVMTALCGLATSFIQLVLARIGVGVGEAGCNPSAHSLIADYFPIERRATALSIYAMGVPLGAMLGLVLGGWLGQEFGWRVAFLAVGLPGLLLVVVVKLLIREPPRGYSDQRPAEKTVPAGTVPPAAPSFRAAMARLWQTKTFRFLCIAAAADAFAGYGLLVWLPTYLVRTFDLELAQVGLRLGFTLGIAGAAGSLMVGLLTDRLGLRDRRFYCWIPAIAACVALVNNLTIFTGASLSVTYGLLVISFLVLPAGGGPLYAAVQSAVPPQMRATAAAVLLLIVNLIGLGFGPSFVGLMSDLLASEFGAESLRISLMVTVSVYVVAASLDYIASRHFRKDLKRIDDAH